MSDGCKVSDAVLRELRSRGGRWAAYQNQDLSSLGRGALQYLRVGEGCTFSEPPDQAPDGPAGLGWRHRYIGMVDLQDGAIK